MGSGCDRAGRTELGGAIGANVLGVPASAVQVGSSNIFTPAQLSSIEPAYKRARAEFSLGADDDLAALEMQLVVSSAPPQLHDPAIPLPPNLMSFRSSALDRAQDAELPDWARGLGVERPLVYATFGTVFNNPSFELPLFPAVMAGLEGEAVDVIITVGPNADPSALGPALPNVRVHRYVPQSLVFPHCAVVVCHAGYGTLLAAIEHAVPDRLRRRGTCRTPGLPVLPAGPAGPVLWSQFLGVSDCTVHPNREAPP